MGPQIPSCLWKALNPWNGPSQWGTRVFILQRDTCDATPKQPFSSTPTFQDSSQLRPPAPHCMHRKQRLVRVCPAVKPLYSTPVPRRQHALRRLVLHNFHIPQWCDGEIFCRRASHTALLCGGSNPHDLSIFERPQQGSMDAATEFWCQILTPRSI